MRNIRNIRNIRIGTSMGIALTLLLAGLTVQATDNLALFGQNSAMPLIIGLVMIAVGITFFLVRGWLSESKKKKALLPTNHD